MSIKAIFPAGVTELVVHGLYQWDYGQTLEIYTDDQLTNIEVHFACVGMTEATVRECEVVGGVARAPIPDHCLEQATPITAWVYEVGENSGETIKTIVMPVTGRTKPQLHLVPPTEIGRAMLLQILESMNAQIARNEKLLTNFEQNRPPEASVTDSSVAYMKTVPENALPYAEILHVGGLTRKCNNLIPFPYDSSNDNYYTVNNDGSITVEGTPPGQNEFTLVNNLPLAKGTYYFSAYGIKMAGIEIFTFNDNKWINKPGAFTLDSDDSISIKLIVNWIESDNPYNETIYPMLNRGSSPLPYEPYFEGLRNAKVTKIESVGANLWSLGDIFSTAYAYEIEGVFANLKPDEQYTISWKYNSNGTVDARNMFIVYTGAGGFSIENGASFTITEEQLNSIQVIYAYFGSDATSGSMTEIMLNKGSAALPYKPYTKHTLEIPSEVQALEGYGWGVNNTCYSYIDWENRVFVNRIGRVDMGALSWRYDSTYKVFTATIEDMQPDSQALLSQAYSNSPIADSAKAPDKSIYGRSVAGTGTNIIGSVGVKDSAYTDAATLKAAMSGVILYYELADPEYVDISNLISSDNFIEVEGGGTITAKQKWGYSYDVPSEIKYSLKTI